MSCAIVAEGGGQRGIYTAGVLDAFLEAGFNPFDLGVGVSSGAQNLLTYFLEQPGYARRAIAELTAAPNFFVPYRWLGTRGVIDLDGYFDRTVSEGAYFLPYDEMARIDGRRRLVFVATERERFEPRYLVPDRESVVRYLKASSAVPFLYRQGVSIDGELLIDGGVSDPLPVRHAIGLGARRVLVLRTLDADGPRSSWTVRLANLRRFHVLPGEMHRMLDRHVRAGAEVNRFLADPPPDVEIVQLLPSRRLESGVFGSRPEALVTDYETGQRDGREMAEALAAWVVAA